MTLTELLHLLARRWYLLILFPLVFAGATAAYCWGCMTDTYTAHTSLYILTKTNNSAKETESTKITTGDTSLSQQIASDMAELVKTAKISKAAAEKLGMKSLAGYGVSTSSESGKRVITISVTGKNPNSVAAVANEVASQAAISAVELMGLEAVNVMEEATPPSAPSGPDRVRYTLIAALVGLVAAVALVVFIDMLDSSVRSSEQAEELFDLPVLGRMPTVKK